MNNLPHPSKSFMKTSRNILVSTATRRRLGGAVVAIALLALAGPAWSFIDAAFTPIDLVEQSQAIADVRIPEHEGDAKQITLAEPQWLKGKAGLVIDLSAMEKTDAEKVRAELQQRAGRGAILFSGNFDGEELGYLHVGTHWLKLEKTGGGIWQAQGFSKQMIGTYSGSSASLAAMARYIMARERPQIPATVGTRWQRETTIGQIPGPGTGLAAVKLPEQDHLSIFAASPQGDRFFRAMGFEEYEDATEAMGLDTRSAYSTWVDLDARGTRDLVSWDGDHLRVLRVADGRFAPLGEPLPIEGGVHGLASLDLPQGETNVEKAILVSTDERPVLLVWQKDGKWKQQPLPDSADAASMPGGSVVVADIDQDGRVDVIQFGAEKSLVWSWENEGFSKSREIGIGTGGGKALVALGDVSGNGRPDLFIAGATQNRLYRNLGDWNFEEVLELSGSLSYKAPPGASYAGMMDLNHDGWTDLALFYPDRTWLYHFNRGFGAMGEENELPLSGGGHTAALAVDLNDDSSFDLVTATADGTVQISYNDLFDVPVALIDLPDGVTSPVTVSAWQGEGEAEFPVAARPVRNGEPGAAIALQKTGEYRLRWIDAAGKAVEKTLEAGNAAQPVTLEP